jgi:exosortase A-associated hydrolase 1
MRRLLSFPCEGATLGASLDGADGRTGVLIVTGGTQTRIGSHRLFERLAKLLAEAGYPCFRFDRRGVGDSDGEDPDFRGNRADMQAAATAFRDSCPALETMVGFGLCDGASSLALFGGEAGLAALIMVNPWLVEAESGAPPPAAIKHHYRQQLLSLSGWKKLLFGSVSYKKLFKGIAKVVAPGKPQGLGSEVAAGLAGSRLPVALILASDDATAVAAAAVWRSASFAKAVKQVPVETSRIATNAHTFSRPGDLEALAEACLAAIGRLQRSGGG